MQREWWKLGFQLRKGNRCWTKWWAADWKWSRRNTWTCIYWFYIRQGTGRFQINFIEPYETMLTHNVVFCPFLQIIVKIQHGRRLLDFRSRHFAWQRRGNNLNYRNTPRFRKAGRNTLGARWPVTDNTIIKDLIVTCCTEANNSGDTTSLCNSFMENTLQLITGNQMHSFLSANMIKYLMTILFYCPIQFIQRRTHLQ